MAVINKGDELAAGLETYFLEMMNYYATQNDVIKQEMGFVEQCCDFIPVDDETIDAAWYGSLASMRAWKGGRQLTGINQYSYLVSAEPYELTIGVTRHELDSFDKYDALKTKLNTMAYKAVEKKVELFVELLESAFATNCYDNQYMVDTDHVDPNAEYTTVQSNKGTSALDATTFAAARTAMRQFKDDRGKGVNSTGDLLIVPPGLEDTAKIILENEWNVDSMDRNINVNRGAARLWVCNYLTDANDWFLINTKGATRPFIMTIAQDTLFTAVMDERAQQENLYTFGADFYIGKGFGNWRYVYGASVT